MAALAPVADPTLLALIERARSADRIAAAAHAAVLDHVVRCQGRPGAPLPPEPEWPAFPSDPGLLSVSQAAHRARRSPDTIGRWCRERSIGKMYGKRWRVSAARLDAEIR